MTYPSENPADPKFSPEKTRCLCGHTRLMHADISQKCAFCTCTKMRAFEYSPDPEHAPEITLGEFTPVDPNAPVDLIFMVALKTTAKPGEARERVAEKFESELKLQFGSAVFVYLMGDVPHDSAREK